MSGVVKCFGGTAIGRESNEEVVVKAPDHAKNKRALTGTRDQVLAMAEREK